MFCLDNTELFTKEDLMSSFGVGIVAGMSNLLLFWLVYCFFSCCCLHRRHGYRGLCGLDDCIETNLSCLSVESDAENNYLVETVKLVV